MNDIIIALKQQAFGLLVLLAAAAALLFPGAFLSWGPVKPLALVVPVLQVIMFGMGTTLSPRDFLLVVRAPWKVALGVGLQFAVMPLLGLALARTLGFEGELAAGLVLTGSVSGGTASNVVCYLAGANVALSVTLTCCSTLLSPFVTPWLMKVLAGQYVDIDSAAMMLEMVKIVLVPVLAGFLAHRLLEGAFRRHERAVKAVLSTISMLGICFVLAAIIAPSRDRLREAGLLLGAAAVLHNLLGYSLGYGSARLLGLVLPLDENDARTLAFEVGMQNSGLASALAVNVLHSPLAALPANIFSVFMDFSGSLLAGFWKNRPPRGSAPAPPHNK